MEAIKLKRKARHARQEAARLQKEQRAAGLEAAATASPAGPPRINFDMRPAAKTKELKDAESQQMDTLAAAFAAMETSEELRALDEPSLLLLRSRGEDLRAIHTDAKAQRGFCFVCRQPGHLASSLECRGPQKTAARQNNIKSSKTPCSRWVKGMCDRAEKCFFSHDGPRGADRSLPPPFLATISKQPQPRPVRGSALDREISRARSRAQKAHIKL